MLRKRTTSICLRLSLVFVILGLSCILCGIFGYAWWIYDSTHVIFGGKFSNGVLLYKHEYWNGTEEIGFYDNFLMFKNDHSTLTGINGERRDTVLLCLIISASFALTSILSILCGSCRMNDQSWGRVTACTAFLTSMSAIPCIGALIYVEVKLDTLWHKLSDRKDSWSYMLAWIGTGFLFLSSLLSFALMCMRPRVGYIMNHNEAYNKNASQGRSNIAYDNKESPKNKPLQTVIVKKNSRKDVIESST